MSKILFQKISLPLVLLTALCLVFLVSYRSYNVPISHDEAETLKMLKDRTYLDILNYSIPEDHMLNSLMIKTISDYWGIDEWQIRLPNLLGFLLYITFSILILWKFVNRSWILPGFLFLGLNPYLIDFFSCARGYGLSVSFLIPSIYYLLDYTRNSNYLAVINAYLMATLGILSMVTMLHFYIVMTGLVVFTIILSFFKFDLLRWISGLLVIAFIAFFSYQLYEYLLIMVTKLSGRSFVTHNAFYNFYEGTIRTISFRSIYTDDPGPVVTILSYTIMGTYLAAFILFIKNLSRNKIKAFFEPNFVVFALGIGMILSVTFQNVLFNIRFPSDRSALFFAPVFMLMILFMLNALHERIRRKWVPTAFIWTFAVLSAINLSIHGNITHYVDWKFDSSGKKMITDLKEYASVTEKPVRLGTFWIFEPSANYYRIKNGYTWLEPVTRDDISSGKFDFYYLRAVDTIGMNFTKSDVLKVYPETETLLLKRQ